MHAVKDKQMYFNFIQLISLFFGFVHSVLVNQVLNPLQLCKIIERTENKSMI